MDSPNLLKRVKHFFHLYNFYPKKRLGQNFTVNSDVLHRLIFHSCLKKNDIVLEVGAGFGFLTELLVTICKKVIAVEFDPLLVKFLKDYLQDLENVELIEGDILKVSLPRFNKVVAAPPYSISSPLLFRLLENKFDSAFLILQKEFAERLAAPVGSKDYGRLTVTIHYRAEVELLELVPRTMFYPSPDVDSMILCLRPRSPPFPVEDEALFFDLVRILFTQRNKKVRNAVLPFLHQHKLPKDQAVIFADSLFYSKKRVRELAPEDFGSMANEIFQKFKS
ncbi:MAG: ribosomal RNA small subunit methyltransferase A [Candidatus Bathyarchaeota archaeon]|nr:16S rRNA (adenine(1518)-N(6)/adenine(1519)-N(6))-dimethyltransferase RsmA [Candidatus Bathyarchaeum tardum]WGM89648.1 MAG: 16S rRNA (adenine(1518)-N(6)/adenine(1519)-N(6))-dimethyltransferase RsmA [Candidatus Bathyarchaeum tardum]WNZ30250.1 MAG: ribosomal RNA small subunit methyltransferase A [Candidatus Bathyarchaeota archaeon]